MDITRIQIKNFLSISSVDLKPGHVNQIVGPNNVGKTTILKAIQAAFEGNTDGAVVKNGEDAAEIVVDLDHLTVRRRIKNDGSNSVSVINRNDQSKIMRPQEFLDSLVNSNAFNPLDLLDPKRRTEALLKSIPIEVKEEDLRAALAQRSPVEVPPLDYKQHGLKVAESAHRYYYQRRAEAARVAKDKRGIADLREKELPAAKEDALPTREEVRKHIEAADKVLVEQRERFTLHRDRQKGLETLQEERINMQNEHVKLIGESKTIQAKINNLSEQLAKMDSVLAKQKEHIEEVKVDQGAVEAAQAQKQSQQELLTRIAEHEAYSARKDAVVQAKGDAAKAEEFHHALDETVEYLSKTFKHELMKKVEMPVPGLTYEGGSFFLDGSSIDNLSSSKAMRLAVAIARRLSGPAKIICLDGAEQLDAETYEALRAEIEGDGFTYFITKVGQAFEVAKGDTVVHMRAGATT